MYTSPVYPHGYSVRLRLKASPSMVAGALRVLGLPVPAGTRRRTWVDEAPDSGTRTRNVMRGSAWLSGRAPKNKRLPLRAFNIQHDLHLYVLAVEQDGNGETFVDVSGVRDSDPSTLLEVVMGLDPDEYEVAYWRQLERYAVLSPPDAHRLGEALDAQPERGRGRLARKEWMVRDYEIPVTVGTRRTVDAMLNVYRIRGGATAVYRAEISLRGRRADRSQISEQDALILEGALRDLLTEHGIEGLAKPDRWEPVDPDDVVYYDENVGRLHAGLYRGQKPRTPTEAECHTPPVDHYGTSPLPIVLFEASSPVSGVSATTSSSGGFTEDEGQDTSPSSTSGGLTVGDGDTSPPTGSTSGGLTPKVKTSKASNPYDRVAVEVLSLPDGFISEVILDGDVPAHRMVEAILALSPATVLYLGTEGLIDLPLRDLMVGNAQGDPSDDLVVLVVDATVPSGVVSSMLEDLRPIYERDGGKLVLLTADRRSYWHPWARDLRSTVSGARYYCHQRYRVGLDLGSGVVVIKDEARGRSGRVFGSKPSSVALQWMVS